MGWVGVGVDALKRRGAPKNNIEGWYQFLHTNPYVTSSDVRGNAWHALH